MLILRPCTSLYVIIPNFPSNWNCRDCNTLLKVQTAHLPPLGFLLRIMEGLTSQVWGNMQNEAHFQWVKMDSEADLSDPVPGIFLTPVIMQVYGNNSFILSIHTECLWSWLKYNPEQQAVVSPSTRTLGLSSTVCVADGLNKVCASCNLRSRYLKTLFAHDLEKL